MAIVILAYRRRNGGGTKAPSVPVRSHNPGFDLTRAAPSELYSTGRAHYTGNRSSGLDNALYDPTVTLEQVGNNMYDPLTTTDEGVCFFFCAGTQNLLVVNDGSWRHPVSIKEMRSQLSIAYF